MKGDKAKMKQQKEIGGKMKVASSIFGPLQSFF